MSQDEFAIPNNTVGCRVFVWGLNDKDQLGGMKGSKVKLPVQSEFLCQLRPVHIAGGSKSLFVVSQEGKVSVFYGKFLTTQYDVTFFSSTRAVKVRTVASVWGTV